MLVRWLVIGTLSTLLAGCQNPEVQRRHARRAENRARTIAMLRKLEARRSDNLAVMMARIEDSYERKCRKTVENRAALQRWWEKEFDRWDESWPRERQRFEELLAGDPESIDRTLPMFLD
jgi:hypothetical protein